MESNLQIVMASEGDRSEIYALYKAQIKREYCPWTDDYPSNETIDWDLSRNALFVLKDCNKIVAAISIEEDDEVDKLSCWDRSREPIGELARLAVLPGEQNKGIGKMMLKFGLEELKRRGYNSIHMLVNKHNIKAIRCYADFGFNVVGECNMYEEDFLCYQRDL